MSRLIAALIALLLIAACSPAPGYDIGADVRPALWRIDGADGVARGYLFGTVHLLPDGVDWQGAALKDAADRSDRLVIEVLGADDPATLVAAFRALAFSPGLPPLAARLPPDLSDDLARAKDAIGLGALRLNGMESWAAALTLASAQQDALGLDRDHGAETVLLADFRAAGKPVGGLETLAQQLGAFDTLPEADQRLMLRTVVRAEGDVRAEFTALLQAWARGDEAGLAAASQGGMMDSQPIRDAILVRRNRAWALRIDALLRGGARPFIAVGAGHLVGADNVRGMLEAMGYKVVRVQ